MGRRLTTLILCLLLFNFTSIPVLAEYKSLLTGYKGDTVITPSSIDGVCLETGEPVEIIKGRIRKGEIVIIFLPERAYTDLCVIVDVLDSLVVLLDSKGDMITIDLW
jgi:hypothetical protein